MHSAKGGWGGQKGEGSSFASLFYGFCVHGIRTSWRGRGVSWKQSSRHSEVERDLEPSPQPRGGAPAVPVSWCGTGFSALAAQC